MPTDKKAAAVLTNPKSSGIAILLTIVDELGTEFFEWEPETLNNEVRDTWKVEMPQTCRDKLWSLVNYLTTNLFFVSLEAFIHTCNALSSETRVNMQEYDPATVAEMCWGITECTLLEPPDDKDVFYDEIKTYMVKQLEAEGFKKVPKMLRKFVTLQNSEERVNESLTQDGIEYNSFWDAQQKKLIALDQEISERLLSLLMELSQLNLKNAQPGAVESLVASARKALGARQTDLQRAAGTVALPPAL